jgi:hypothetical protein
MDLKTITLNGGKPVIVLVDDNSPEPKPITLNVRQFKVREYPTLAPYMNNELELCARACTKPRAFIESLTPDSFEVVCAAVWEVNGSGFFTWSERQLKRGNQMISELVHRGVSAEKVVELLQQSISSTPSRTVPPPAG